MKPQDRYLTLHQGIRLHYLEWGDSKAPPLIFVHGRLDIAHSWDRIAPALAEHYRVLALDLRGHGGSDFVGAGAHYAVASFMLDLHALIEHGAGGGPVTLVGHSLGGLTSSFYAGTFPEKVTRFVNIEGFGPLDPEPERTREMTRKWIERTVSAPEKERRPYDSPEEAAAQLTGKNRTLPEDFAEELARYGTERGSDDKYRWRFDPRFRNNRPQTFTLEQARYIWGRILCPVLVIVGTASRLPQWSPDWRTLAAFFPDVQVVELEGLTHMMHQSHPGLIASEILKFLQK